MRQIDRSRTCFNVEDEALTAENCEPLQHGIAEAGLGASRLPSLFAFRFRRCRQRTSSPLMFPEFMRRGDGRTAAQPNTFPKSEKRRANSVLQYGENPSVLSSFCTQMCAFVADAARLSVSNHYDRSAGSRERRAAVRRGCRARLRRRRDGS